MPHNSLRRRFSFLITVTTVCLFIAATVHALPVISFDQQVDGGTVSYDGIGGPLIGTDIRFDFVRGSDTPANNDAVLTCDGCRLNFETGANVAEPSVGSPIYLFGGGGFFTLTGDVLDGNDLIASGTLKEGGWNAPVLALAGPGGRINIGGFGTDALNADLADFFGLPGDKFAYSFTAVLTEVVTEANGGFTGNIEEADVVNTITTTVPEPNTLLLLGGALAGLGFWGRRKLHG
jgi:hypothetical protein